MSKSTQALRFSALGALVLGFACAGFIASASADEVISNDAAKNITNASDVGQVGSNNAPHGNAPGSQPATGSNTAHGNAPGPQANGGQQGRGHNPGSGIGTGGNPTGEGALLEGNCFADMPVYSKDGKYVGRGIVNTCN